MTFGTEPLARLTISVVSHGHCALLAALLDDLAQWQTAGDIIVVTLNIPEPELERSRWPGVLWIDNPKPKGFGANHNAALFGRASRWFAILNPDIRIETDILTALLAHADSDPEIGLIAPGVIGPDGTPQDSARRLLTPFRLLLRSGRRLSGRGIARPAQTADELDWLAGMFVLVRQAAFAAINGFDERFFLYCEDMDLCIRLQLLGYRIKYVRQTVVVHDARRDSHQSGKHLRWHIASLLQFWSTLTFWRYLLRKSNGFKLLPIDL